MLAESRDAVMSPGAFSTGIGGGLSGIGGIGGAGTPGGGGSIGGGGNPFDTFAGAAGAGSGSKDRSSDSLRHALGVIDKLQGQLLNLRAERNALDERGAVADLEMQRRAETIADLKRRLSVSDDRAREARTALDRKSMELGAHMEDLQDELRGCRMAAEEDQARWKRSEKRIGHLEAQLAMREKRVIELEEMHRTSLVQAQTADGAFEKRLAKREERHGSELQRQQAEHELQLQRLRDDLKEQRSEADRLREVASRLQTELDNQASTLGAERARFQEAERLAKTHEASLRDALGAAKVEVARRDERLRGAETSRRTATQALDEANARFKIRSREQAGALEQMSSEAGALQRVVEDLAQKHELELKALERHYKHDIRKLRKIAKRAIAERDEALTATGPESDPMLQRRLVDEVIRLQAEKQQEGGSSATIAAAASSPLGSSTYTNTAPARAAPSPSSYFSPSSSIPSPRRRSPRSRSSSPRKKSVGSGSPTLAKRRGGQSPRVEAPLATAMGGTFSSRSSNHNNQEEDYLGGGDDYGDELYDDANDVSELNQTDGDLEFLGRFVARGYGGRKKDQVPTRRAGGMSWEVDMR